MAFLFTNLILIFIALQLVTLFRFLKDTGFLEDVAVERLLDTI